jgi:hypothetical protein
MTRGIAVRVVIREELAVLMETCVYVSKGIVDIF